jgi:hypothetical protein
MGETRSKGRLTRCCVYVAHNIVQRISNCFLFTVYKIFILSTVSIQQMENKVQIKL